MHQNWGSAKMIRHLRSWFSKLADIARFFFSFFSESAHIPITKLKEDMQLNLLFYRNKLEHYTND